MTLEEQLEALLDDLTKAEQAGLVIEGTRPAWPNVYMFYINNLTVDMTEDKHKVLSKYLVTRYPNVDVTVNIRGPRGEQIYIQFINI